MAIPNTRPDASVYPAFYAGYVNRVPDGDYLSVFRQNTAEAIAVLDALTPQQWDYRYAEGKWSVKEMVLHVIDTERIMSYRALRISRGDQTPLPGFEQDDYIPASAAGRRSAQSLIEEFRAVRQASLALFENLPEEAWQSSGTASNKPINVHALAYIVVGHELHHRMVLEEKYFKGLSAR